MICMLFLFVSRKSRRFLCENLRESSAEGEREVKTSDFEFILFENFCITILYIEYSVEKVQIFLSRTKSRAKKIEFLQLEIKTPYYLKNGRQKRWQRANKIGLNRSNVRANRKRNIKRSINSRHFSPSFLSLSLFLSRDFFYRSLVRKTRFDRRDKKRTQLKRNRKNRKEEGVTRFRSRANRKKNFERNTELRKISMFFLFSLIRINRIIRAKTMK